jgi:hypothetical protein
MSSSQTHSFDLAEQNSDTEGRFHGLACCLSGLLVGSLTGLVVGRLIGGSFTGQPVVIALATGAIIGVLFGRKIASIPTVLRGIAFGAFLPFGLCLLDGIRRGRFNDLGRVAKDLQSPQGLLVIGLFLGVGGGLGGLLVGIRKLIERCLSGKGAAE